MKDYEKMKIFSCPLCCNIAFTNLADLKKHLLKTTTAIRCPGCYTSCKDIILLIKHLDECSATPHDSLKDKQTHYQSANDLSTSSRVSDDDDDDVEGYFCTVCDIKIPDLYQHIHQFHNGQEVILQDDDDEDEDTDIKDSKPSEHDIDTRLKKENVINGIKKIDEQSEKKCKTEEDVVSNIEVYYCSQCHTSFQSLADHTTKYHQNDDVSLKDVPVAELFPESKLKSGTFGYFCSCCQKTIARRSTLPRHLKLGCGNNKAEVSEPSYQVEVVNPEPFDFIDG